MQSWPGAKTIAAPKNEARYVRRRVGGIFMTFISGKLTIEAVIVIGETNVKRVRKTLIFEMPDVPLEEDAPIREPGHRK